MTLGECIQRCDALRPNRATEGEKARWALAVEGELVEGFFPRYAAPPPVADPPRRWPEDATKTLSASGPYEGLCVHRVLAQVELMDQELDSRNAHTAVANALEDGFRKAWHREHGLRGAR